MLKDKGHPLNTQLEEQIAKLVPNNITIESKLWETMSLHPLEDSLKQGSKRDVYRVAYTFWKLIIFFLWMKPLEIRLSKAFIIIVSQVYAQLPKHRFI